MYVLERFGAFIEKSDIKNIDHQHTALKSLSLSLKIRQGMCDIDTPDATGNIFYNNPKLGKYLPRKLPDASPITWQYLIIQGYV